MGMFDTIFISRKILPDEPWEEKYDETISRQTKSLMNALTVFGIDYYGCLLECDELFGLDISYQDAQNASKAITNFSGKIEVSVCVGREAVNLLLTAENGKVINAETDWLQYDYYNHLILRQNME
jgi:hypothetical protein